MTVSNTGFTLKRLSEIREEFKQNFKALYPNANMNDETVNGQINALFADAYSDIYELAQDVYNSNDPAGAEGYSLDKIAAIAGIKRQPETFSETTLYIYTNAAAYLVAAGYQASLSTDAATVFETYEDAVSANKNEITILNFSDVPDSGSFSLSIDGTANTTASMLFSVVASSITTNINAVLPATVALTTGAIGAKYFTIYWSDGVSHVVTLNNSLTKAGNPITTSVSRNQRGGTYARAGATCLTAGPVTALMDTITNPITVDGGVASVTNPFDATRGSYADTDADLRYKMINNPGNSLGNTEAAIRNALFELNETEGNSGYIIEYVKIMHNRNDTATATMPAHSYEVTVYYPSNPSPGTIFTEKDTEIFQAIANVMPVGIEITGGEFASVTDDYGNTLDVYFTRPTAVPISAVVTVTVDTDYWPSDGADQVINAIVNWGDTLGPGKDVIVHGYNSLETAISAISGIVDIAINLNGGGDANITIDDGTTALVEISTWSTADVAITVV